MKLTQEQLINIGIVLAGVYIVRRLGIAHQLGSDALKPVTDTIGNAWTALTQGPGVEGSFAYVVLKSRDFENGYLKALSRKAIEQMHPGNAGLLSQVVNQAGQIQQQYAPLLLAGGLAIDENGVYAL